LNLTGFFLFYPKVRLENNIIFMTTLKFKTNIKCDGCIAKVTPFLNAEATIEKWDVDIANSDKVLTVSGEKISEDLIKNLLKNEGYTAEKL